jgi:3-hydroxyisobutyrate dehydrogenase
MAKDVALLGTGIIGSGMSNQLLDAGHRLTVWNRSADKARPLQDKGATVASTAIEAVDGADFVLTVLADGHAVRNVMLAEGSALEGMGRDSVWVQMSTVGLEETEEFDRLAKESGVHFVDAPVLGTRGPAEKGQLTVLAAGSPRIIERCQPIFDAVAQRTMHLDKACYATRLKLVVNDWVLGLLGVLAETFATAEALGVRPQLFLEAISGGPLDAGYARIKGQMMQQGEFEPSFPLRLALKDARLIERAASTHGFEPRIMKTIAEHFEQALDDGHGEQDMSAIYRAMTKS